MQRVEQVYKNGEFTVVIIGKSKNPTVYFMKENYYHDYNNEKYDGDDIPIHIGARADEVLEMDYYLKMSAKAFSTIASIAKMRWGFRI